jgi:hypothetical protein
VLKASLALENLNRNEIPDCARSFHKRYTDLYTNDEYIKAFEIFKVTFTVIGFRFIPRQPGAKKGHDRLRGTRDEL